MPPFLFAYELFSPPALPLYFLLLDTLSLTHTLNSEALSPPPTSDTHIHISKYSSDNSFFSLFPHSHISIQFMWRKIAPSISFS